EFEVVAVVADGHALLREAETAQPDVVVTDIAMPGGDGITATGELLARRPGTRVVLVTVHDDPELVARGDAAGALACVLEVTAAQDLAPAVRAVLRGERYVSPHASRGGRTAPRREDTESR